MAEKGRALTQREAPLLATLAAKLQEKLTLLTESERFEVQRAKDEPKWRTSQDIYVVHIRLF